jgi:hypothetical protein
MSLLSGTLRKESLSTTAITQVNPGAHTPTEIQERDLYMKLLVPEPQRHEVDPATSTSTYDNAFWKAKSGA